MCIFLVALKSCIGPLQVPETPVFLCCSYPQAAFRALKLTLQLVASLHDIVAYLFSFAKLGSCPACFDFPLSPRPLRSDWGGAKGVGK